MYNELIKALRETDFSDGCPCGAEPMCKDKDCVILQAADAIEDLSAAVEGYESSTNMAFVEKDGETVIEFQPKWIPVTERLPEGEKDVLVWVSIGKAPIVAYDVDCYNEHAKRWVCFENDVTHWMPLPPAPKEELA